MHKKQEFRNLIVELVRLFNPNTYVEIGSRFGYVFNEVSKYTKRSVAVDIIEMDKIVERPGVEYHQKSSKDFAAEWTDPIDLLFIDADHSAKVLASDFMELSKWVEPHTGLILLHDTYPVNERLLKPDRCHNAWIVAKGIKHEPDFEIVTLPGPWAGLSIIRKVFNSHGWMDTK